MTAGQPIAIVGMACRFPGADSAAAFGELLRAGACGVGPVPAERRALRGEGGPEPAAVGLVDGIDRFDRHAFRISANEAPLIDPQQRLVLEMAWHALEDAGLPPSCLDGTAAGVFVGAGSSDHALRMAVTGEIKGNPHLPNAVQNAAISGRVSYCLGLTGPSLTVDSACSSALAAVALAGDALRLGQCDLALAGGVNVLLSPAGFRALQATGVLSGQGQTRAFDAAADGFVRSEGCGLLVLKRLPDAVASGDRIHAVLRGWATGQDGRSNGLSAPSRAAQVRVMERALRTAGLSPDDIGAIEAHGSATALGDAIEAQALAEVFAGRTGPKAALGSVKAALGHLEAAAGIAGLMKAILMVRDGFVPAQPCFATPSPRVDWDGLPLAVPRTTRDWPGSRRAVGVSSFGMSGLNAHVIVAAAQDEPDATVAGAEPARGPHLFLLSAANAPALMARAGQLAAALGRPDIPLGRLAVAVSRRWSGMGLRAGFLASTREEALVAVQRIQSDRPPRAARIAGQVLLDGADQSAEGLALLRRACPDLVSGTEAGDAGAVQISPERVEGVAPAVSALLALHLAGAPLHPQAIFAADPAAPDLPGYPFDRQRCWYDDMPAPGRR